MVETLRRFEIVGNRRLRANEIMSLIQTRPGDLYKEQQIKKDLERILATGYFVSRVLSSKRKNEQVAES
jgi:outer membrane protein assembly factor BamA